MAPIVLRAKGRGGADMRAAMLILLLAGLPGAGTSETRPETRVEESRAIAAEFQQTLGGRLKSAMAEGDPLRAIDVCAIQAPDIAAGISAESGAVVGRTALRVRNPGNAPDADAAVVLERFVRQVAAAEGLPVEHSALRPDGGIRYMQAIVMQPLCTTCHGVAIATTVTEALDTRYPGDQATGFEVGELRGAFIIDWPAPQQTGTRIQSGQGERP